MQLSISYDTLASHLPSVVESISQAFLKEREKNTHKFSIPEDPAKWHWRVIGQTTDTYSLTPDKHNPTTILELIEKEINNGHLTLFVHASYNDVKSFQPFPAPSEKGFSLPPQLITYLDPKTKYANNTNPTVFIYTEEKRGDQLVESIVLSSLTDISGSEKLIVIKDPYNDINFVYKIATSSSNLEAVCMLSDEECNPEKNKNIVLNHTSFKINSPTDAMKLLKNKTRWIQDKGSVLSVLLQKARKENPLFHARPIARPYVTKIPDNAPVDLIISKEQVTQQPKTMDKDKLQKPDPNRKQSVRVYV